MSIRTKAVLMLLVAVMLLYVALYTVSTRVVSESFTRIEEQYALKNVGRVVRAVREKGLDLDRTVKDWAFWDDTYQFVRDKNPEYIQENLMPESFLSLRIHFMAFLTCQGEPVWTGTLFDGATDLEPLPNELLEHQGIKTFIKNCFSTEQSISGVLDLQGGPVIIAARPILTSLRQGPPSGILIIGRSLDAEAIQEISGTLQIELTALPAVESSSRAVPEDVYPALISGTPGVVTTTSDTHLAAFGLIRDISGKPAILFKVVMPRDIYAEGLRATHIFMAFLILACATFSIIVLVSLQHLILSRLGTLCQHIRLISKSGDFSQRVLLPGNDELAEVAESLNRLLAVVENSRKALIESEAAHRVLVEGLPDIVTRFNSDGRHLFVSDNIRNVLNLPAEQVIGKTHRDLGFTDEQCRFIEDSIRKTYASGTPFETEVSFDLNGKNVVHNLRFIPERDAEGKVQSVLMLSRDITEHRQAEENYQILFREMLDGFILCEILYDPQNHPIDSVFLAVNPAFERMTGLPADKIVGSKLHESIPSAAPGWIDIFARVTRSGEPDTFEHHDPLTNKFFEVTVFRPAIGQVACIYTDISERKQAEEDRTTLEMQLHQAQKMESVGRLAGGVAHDFNNMLSVIMGHAELAIASVDTSHAIYTDLDEIQKAASRSADLTRQLLAFARKQTISPKILRVNETIEKMLSILRRLIGEDIELVWRPGPGLGRIKMDPSQIDQIFTNLVVNARDAINGVGKITIETANTFLEDYLPTEHEGCAPGNYVMLSISDTGSGIDPETLEHVFEPFFTTKGVGQGTGLGLSTVYGIVRQNRGFINVISKPGQGATFQICLPQHTEIKQDEPDRAIAKPAPPGHETILLVEDEPAILKLAASMLELLGYTVLTANGPAEAIPLVETYQGRIDLLMTDVVMPGMNGKDLARIMRQRLPDIRCLFMSGYTADVIAPHGVLDSDAYFIHKPFSMDALATKTRQAITGQ